MSVASNILLQSTPPVPFGTRAIWDFRNWRGSRIPDLSGYKATRTLTNILANGNFVDTTGYTGVNCTLAAASNVLSATGDGGDTYGRVYAAASSSPTSKVLYIKATVSVTNAVCDHVDVRLRDGTGGTVLLIVTQNTPTNGTWYELAGVVTSPASFSTGLYILFDQFYASAGTQNGKVMKIKNVVVYDLTAASAVDTAANITALLAENGVTYHDGAQAMQYRNDLVLSGATDTGLNRYFDGSDDYGYAANSPALDITAAPLAVFAMVKPITGNTTGYVFSKNLDSSNNTQYGLVWDTAVVVSNGLFATMNGQTRANSVNGAVALNNWNDMGFIWDGINVQCYVNKKPVGAAGAWSTALTTRPYVCVGRRETAATYFKGNIDNVCIYASSDMGAILRHRQWYMRRVGIA